MHLGTVLVMLLLICIPGVAPALELGELDAGKQVPVLVGERVSIVLPGNPTTGYVWELNTADRRVLAPDPEPLYRPDSTLNGAGGRYTFRFMPRNEGKAAVRLSYHRPWEKNVAPLRSFDLTLTVAADENISVACYRSREGKTATASFDRRRNQVTVILPDGREVTLPVALSASGARYSDGRETFWEHQGTGRFFRGEELLFEGQWSDAEPAVPQPRFRSFDQADILSITSPPASSGVGEEVRAPLGAYFYRAASGNTIEVVAAGGKILAISVPEFSHRPLTARWINAKLLFLELWFNPHNGACWIYDVEQRRVVRGELFDDGQSP